MKGSLLFYCYSECNKESCEPQYPSCFLNPQKGIIFCDFGLDSSIPCLELAGEIPSVGPSRKAIFGT